MKRKVMNAYLGIFTLVIAVFMISCGGAPPPAEVPPPPPPVVETPAPQPADEPASPPAVAPTPPPAQSQTGIRRDRNNLILNGAQNRTVTRGDTLSEIARDAYGDGLYFPILLLASSDHIRDPDLIELGDNIVIPDLQRNLSDPAARTSIMRTYEEAADLMRRRNHASYAESLRRFAANL